jgi:hypothetical protein
MRNGLITNSQGDRMWYHNGLLHRTNGPAVEYADGSKRWYQNNQLHRTDGPAIEFIDGTKMWYQNNKRHRTNGPAIEYDNGYKFWWFKGYEYTFIDWLNLVDFTEPQKTVMRLQYA